MSEHETIRLDTVERAIADIAAGKPVVVVDDETRENEGDIIFAASKATPELMAFTIRTAAASSASRCRQRCSTASRSR
jgi:3,4-dihydroxy 2-butanone 4-phosphate synthase/GTP cyclohydrolase II